MEKPKSGQKPTKYQAYLLRCWCEGSDWRFSLESIGDERQQRGYRDLAELLTAVANDLDIDHPASEQAAKIRR